MKKRVVAILLSFTLCSAMVTEAGAAAFADPSVVVASEAAFGDQVESTEAEQSEEVQTESPEEVEDGNIAIDGTEGEQASDEFSDSMSDEGADITVDDTEEVIPGDEPASGDTSDENTADIPDAEVEFTEELFSAGDSSPVTLETEENTADVLAADIENIDEENHKATVLHTRWKLENGKWKLAKPALPVRNAAAAGTVEVLDGTAADDGVVQDMTAEEPSAGEAELAFEDQENVVVESEEQPAPETEVIPETEPEAEAVPETEVYSNEAVVGNTTEYFTNQMVEITTVSSDKKELEKGIYYFDEDGYLVTGRRTVKKNTPGFQFGSDAEFYFLDASRAKVTNTNTEEGKNLTPFNSALGQMQKNYNWLWDGGAFHNYGSDGRAAKITGNKMYNINGQYYYLLNGGKPFVGIREATWNNKKSWYYFKNASGSNSIPGVMAKKCWGSRKTPGGQKWMYFGATGRWEKKPAGIYKVMAPSKNTDYVLNSSGYLVKNNIVTTPGGSVYMGNKWGWAYKDSVVKYKNARYYFGKDGKRVNWKNRWIKVPNGNKKPRYYYLGSNPGRIQEKHGIQKIVMNKKFVGWFMFDSKGNNLQSAWSGDRYFISDGRMASGFLKLGNTAYFMERSSSTKCRGKKYKNQWIKYNNKYYYATRTGRLYGGGWKTINGGRYYFKDWTAVTNKTVKDPSTNKYGYLNSRGKYETEWITYDPSKNYARYIDPETGKVLKNTVKVINGVNYRFDKNGNRVTDRTNEFRQKSYYIECDRVNGVMTVYTNSKKTTPIKTIRVSVGNPGTPTPLMTNEKIDRAGRWQLLMGPSYGQYGTHVRGGIYIHSIACGLPHANNLPAGEYLKLGNPASHGCIRCCVADAKWIWDNCNGSRITVFDGKYTSNECFKGPLGRNPLKPLRGNGTFDPTDPIYN